MKLDDLKKLDLNNVGNAPVPIKFGIILIVSMSVLLAGYWFDTKDQVAALQKVQEKETELKQTFEAKQRRAANLEPLKEQLRQMKQSFGALLRLLPNRTEIEGLLVDISQAGLGAGLEFELFRPEEEKPAEFYAIQPITIRVAGTYHEFGEFISAVAALPRIVTQHDISITPRKDAKKGTTELVMDMTAKTYRYLEEEEVARQADKSGKKGKRKKKRR
ncbi:MAG: type 4a pilus biogenesis protein PilO [Gammaproteobacteria bacterium]|nr:type 4a pilus biogenesis protein PilO [Gammaproteobacteria bacterium]NIR82227.1 type 4a pilus biogenesis protein PilO [Gammaproteobacteria bacterium]NIR90826.1 type 4a pilus biogenesis protein PilO [Gammaproteobacteria bacterium]NIU03377.1 type 4a pilus biogenesis protein PilO [Gammaproteobacteria bacterium]NIV50873.1 type 4a pilus biogenesis protein PilO [Gammaproteobacteria bacterium]